MKRLILAAAAMLALGGCNFGALVSAPAPVSLTDKTMLDEQAALAVELAYKAARLAGETATDAGLIKGATATKVAALDNKAFAALGAVRSAYKAGNAADYASALALARTAIGDMIAAFKGN